jgi:hypothetical protein
MQTAIQNAIAGAALAPIGSSEKRELAILCRRAWEKLGRPGLDECSTAGEAFDRWRHRQSMLCVERPGLRQCRHEDFNFLKAHMLRILGATRQADQSDLRAANAPRRQALAKLQAECRAAVSITNPMGYVRAIARSKFKTTLIESDLSANQIWQLVFSLRSAESRRRQAGQASSVKGGRP